MVRMPESVETVGDVAFYGCENLQTVTVNGMKTTFGDYAFSECAPNLVIKAHSNSTASAYAEKLDYNFTATN
jgi:hypothetical protein